VLLGLDLEDVLDGGSALLPGLLVLLALAVNLGLLTDDGKIVDLFVLQPLLSVLGLESLDTSNLGLLGLFGLLGIRLGGA
jgi:hypothetical protein